MLCYWTMYIYRAMRKKGSPGHTATAGYMAGQSQRNSPEMHFDIDFEDEPQPALASRGLTSSQLQVCSVFLAEMIRTLYCRHHVPIGKATLSLRPHLTTPATDRDHPPPWGFHLHPTCLRFTLTVPYLKSISSCFNGQNEWEKKHLHFIIWSEFLLFVT